MEEILYLRDAKGKLLAVQVPAALWEKLNGGKAVQTPDAQPPEPLAEFDDFMASWTFPYQYEPAVACPGCNAKTADWQRDPAHPFHLRSASIGGVLVFRCGQCAGTIRQKYFKDHVAVEFTPPGR